jgi:uncharacterized RmlC-like cupin family protein
MATSTDVSELLAAHPRPSGVDREVLARCIAECYDCARSCTICVDADLAEQDVAEMGAEVPLHWHDHDQVIYVLSGSGRVIVGDDEVVVTRRDVVVAPAHIPHRVCAAPKEGLDTLVAMPATVRSFRPDGSEMETPWHT